MIFNYLRLLSVNRCRKQINEILIYKYLFIYTIIQVFLSHLSYPGSFYFGAFLRLSCSLSAALRSGPCLRLPVCFAYRFFSASASAAFLAASSRAYSAAGCYSSLVSSAFLAFFFSFFFKFAKRFFSSISASVSTFVA